MILEPPGHLRGAKKERIIRALLVIDGEHQSNVDDVDRHQAEIAAAAGVSESWCSEYLARLERLTLVDGLRVIDAEGLYQEWEAIRPPRNSVTASIQFINELLEETELEYVLTTYVAENIHQGQLFASRTEFYVRNEDVPAWVEIIQNRGLIGGGDTRIWLTDEGVFSNAVAVDQVRTVSIPQLIIDLRYEGGPAYEAADLLLEKYHVEK